MVDGIFSYTSLCDQRTRNFWYSLNTLFTDTEPAQIQRTYTSLALDELEDESRKDEFKIAIY